MARFEREARLLAAVNHPNIASIYSVEDVNGQRLLVMEYIAGESLADRLRRGPLPIDETLDVARQIAAAVEAAHEGGIVHRDLKPGNVRVTPDGTVKVLDFGLAKGPVTSDAEQAQSPTLTYSPTGLGVILGTAGYMSPEQARGKPVDRRADVWAFGCVVFECFTGKKTFEGETVSDTIARILEREPAWSDLPAPTPPRVRELLRRCLEKDLKKRQRDMGDVRLEIEEAQATKSSISRAMDTGPVASAAAPARRSMPAAVIAAIALIIGAAAGIGIWNLAFSSPRAGAAAPISLSLSMPPSIRALGRSFARGTNDLVLFRGVERRPDGTEDPSGRLFVRRLGSFELTPLAGSEGAFGYAPSPDGRAVVVWRAVSAQSADSRLVRLSVDGSSPPLTIAEWDPAWRDMIWLSDGDLLVLTAGFTQFLRIPTTGGPPKPPVAIDMGGASGYPLLVSEVAGAGVLLRVESWGARGYQQDVWLLDPVTGKAKRLIENGASPFYVASTGHLFFSRGPALMAVRFDPATKAVVGDAVGVFDGLQTNLWSSGDFFAVGGRAPAVRAGRSSGHGPAPGHGECRARGRALRRGYAIVRIRALGLAQGHAGGRRDSHSARHVRNLDRGLRSVGSSPRTVVSERGRGESCLVSGRPVARLRAQRPGQGRRRICAEGGWQRRRAAYLATGVQRRGLLHSRLDARRLGRHRRQSRRLLSNHHRGTGGRLRRPACHAGGADRQTTRGCRVETLAGRTLYRVHVRRVRQPGTASGRDGRRRGRRAAAGHYLRRR
jgi:serine/threonine-protein kinase